ncbi:hypothetical protein LUA82_04775 [Neoehrlichia mikurensis]|uniref:Uncharacterized protein n=1 Tax=Neoehrlichia mikurensis TaxID=89586 RepID=A0A9Q9BS56_9RICK|nr:hypothetical protein [Neoehrlichia mikurensis]UTO55450.1 hypothetical protein LUA82_04775 [Neoehrlichia mikurensis]
MTTHFNNYKKNVTSKSDTFATTKSVKNNRVFNNVKASIQKEEEPIYDTVKAPIRKKEEPIYAKVKSSIRKKEEPIYAKVKSSIQKKEEPIYATVNAPVQKKEKPTYVTTIYATVNAPVQKKEEPIYDTVKAPIRKEEEPIYDTVKAPIRKKEEPIYAKVKAPIRKEEEPIYDTVKAPVQKEEEPVYDTMKSVKNNKEYYNNLLKELVSNNNVDKDINNTRAKFSFNLLINSLVNILRSIFIGQNAKNDTLVNSDQKKYDFTVVKNTVIDDSNNIEEVSTKEPDLIDKALMLLRDTIINTGSMIPDNYLQSSTATIYYHSQLKYNLTPLLSNIKSNIEALNNVFDDHDLLLRYFKNNTFKNNSKFSKRQQSNYKQFLLGELLNAVRAIIINNCYADKILKSDEQESVLSLLKNFSQDIQTLLFILEKSRIGLSHVNKKGKDLKSAQKILNNTMKSFGEIVEIINQEVFTVENSNDILKHNSSFNVTTIYDTVKAPIRKEEEPIYDTVKAPIRKEEEPIYDTVKAPIRKEEEPIYDTVKAPIRKEEEPIYDTVKAPIRKEEEPIYDTVKAPIRKKEEPIYDTVKAPIRKEEEPIYDTVKAPIRKEEEPIYDTVKAPVQKEEEPIYAKVKSSIQKKEEPIYATVNAPVQKKEKPTYVTTIYATVNAPVQKKEEPIYDTMKSVKNNKEYYNNLLKELVSNNNVDKDINNTRAKFSFNLLINSLVNILRSVFIGQNAKNDTLVNSDQKNDVVYNKKDNSKEDTISYGNKVVKNYNSVLEEFYDMNQKKKDIFISSDQRNKELVSNNNNVDKDINNTRAKFSFNLLINSLVNILRSVFIGQNAKNDTLVNSDQEESIYVTMKSIKNNRVFDNVKAQVQKEEESIYESIYNTIKVPIRKEEEPIYDTVKAPIRKKEEPVYATVKAPIRKEEEPIYDTVKAPIRKKEEPIYAKVKSSIQKKEEPIYATVKAPIRKEEEPVYATVKALIQKKEEPIYATVKAPIRKEEEPVYATVKALIQKKEEPIYAKVKSSIQKKEEPIYATVKASIQKKEEPVYATVKAPIRKEEEPIYDTMKSVKNNKEYYNNLLKELVSNNNVDKDINNTRAKFSFNLLINSLVNILRSVFIGQNAKNDTLVNSDQKNDVVYNKKDNSKEDTISYGNKVVKNYNSVLEEFYDMNQKKKDIFISSDQRNKELVSNNNNVDKDINNTRVKFSFNLLINSLVNILRSVFIGQNAKNDTLVNSDQKNDVKKSIQGNGNIGLNHDILDICHAIDEQNIDMIKSLAKDDLMHVVYNNIMDYATSTGYICNPDILKALIEKNANYNVVCKDGSILLSRLLTTPEYKSIGKMLLENYNVDFKMRNVHGENILCELLACGEYETLLSVINILPSNTLQELVLQRDCKGENFISKTVTAYTVEPDNAYLESISKVAMNCAGLCVNQFANNDINILEGDRLSSNVQKYANVQNCANRAM